MKLALHDTIQTGDILISALEDYETIDVNYWQVTRITGLGCVELIELESDLETEVGDYIERNVGFYGIKLDEWEYAVPLVWPPYQACLNL